MLRDEFREGLIARGRAEAFYPDEQPDNGMVAGTQAQIDEQTADCAAQSTQKHTEIASQGGGTVKTATAVVAMILTLVVAAQASANALVRAAEVNDAAKITALLKAGADPNDVDDEHFKGDMPLRAAARRGHTEAIIALLKGGAAPNAISGTRGLKPARTALFSAARAGHTEAVRALLNGGADAKMLDHGQPLEAAANEGHAETVTVLLAAGAEPNPPPLLIGHGPLLYAAKNGHAETIAALLTGGVDLHVLNKIEEGPLHLAARGDHTDAVIVLLEAGADPNARTTAGNTPLHWAGRAETISALLDGGADPKAVDDKGRMAIPDNKPARRPKPLCDTGEWEDYPACWLKMKKPRGCHIWLGYKPREALDKYLEEGTASWSGRCTKGIAEGDGTITILSGEEGGAKFKYELTGRLWRGTQRGEWEELFDVEEPGPGWIYNKGRYVSGTREGNWYREVRTRSMHRCEKHEMSNDETVMESLVRC